MQDAAANSRAHPHRGACKVRVIDRVILEIVKCRTFGNRDDETARRQPAGRQRIRKNARIGVSDFIVVVFQKRTPAAYGARHHARPCDRLKNNSPQTAGDAFGTDPTVGHRTKLIINYGKNDLPTRKKMRCTPPTATPAPRQSGQSDHRQPLAPAARQNPEPGFFVPRPGGHRQTTAG